MRLSFAEDALRGMKTEIDRRQKPIRLIDNRGL